MNGADLALMNGYKLAPNDLATKLGTTMMDQLKLVLLLKNTAIFKEVLSEDLRVVATELQPELFIKGDRVFDINEPGDTMYIIQEGKIGISLGPIREQSSNHFIAQLGQGECFGEMSLFDDEPRSATAHVLEESKLYTLNKGKLKGLIIHYPELGLGILRSMSIRLRLTNRKLT